MDVSFFRNGRTLYSFQSGSILNRSTSLGRGLHAPEPMEGWSDIDAEPKLWCWCSWREKGGIVVHPTSSCEPLWAFSTVGCWAFLPAVRHEWELQWRKKGENKTRWRFLGGQKAHLCVFFSRVCSKKSSTCRLIWQAQTVLYLSLFGENKSVKECVLMTLL